MPITRAPSLPVFSKPIHAPLGAKFIESASIGRRVCPTTIHGMEASAIEGVAITSLYEELCAAAALKSVAGEQAFAPVAFVSNLAGVLLVIKLLQLRRIAMPPERELPYARSVSAGTKIPQ